MLCHIGPPAWRSRYYHCLSRSWGALYLFYLFYAGRDSEARTERSRGWTHHRARGCAARGVVLQPVQVAGGYDGFDPARDRLTLSEVRRRILEQTNFSGLRTLFRCRATPTLLPWLMH